MKIIAPVFLLVMSAAHVAFAATTATSVAITTPSLVMGATTTAIATVTDTSGSPVSPAGTVTWSDGGASGTYDFTCTLSPVSASASSCSITYGPGGAFPAVTLTATYEGAGVHDTSTGSGLITVNKRATATSVSPNTVQVAAGTSVVFTATVSDTSPSPACCFTPDVNPVSAVVWSAGPSSPGSFSSSGICSVSRVAGSLTDSSCSITYTATSAGAITITADYAGDNTHEASSGAATVSRPQRPPVADAGPDQTVNTGMLVPLDGTSSFDPDGDLLTYSWTQTVGPTVSLTGANTPAPSFVAPTITAQTTLTFQLTVSDGALSGSDTVHVVAAPSTIFAFEPVISLNAPGAVGTHPTVAVSGRNVYVVWMNNIAEAISFTKSADAGATFGPVVNLTPPSPLCSVSIPCFPSGASAPVVASSGNHVYVAWVDVHNGVFVARSDDGGLTFSPASNVVPLGSGQGTGVQIAVSGEFVHVLSYSCCVLGSVGELLLSTSANFGLTFSTTTLSSQIAGCCGQIAASYNNVYVAWHEAVTPTSSGPVIQFVSSNNNGATLNAARMLSSPADTSFFPQIAVSGSRVYVAWDDRTTGQVMFRSSTDEGATFGTTSNLLTGATVGAAIPGLAADASAVHAFSAPQSMPYPIEFKASGNFGGVFGASQTLNNSPLFPSGNICCAVYPQIVAQGSGVYVVWGALPASASTGRDIAFTYSTNNGATFGGPINLSNNPDFSELTFGAGSTYLNRVDEMAVSGGRVHIVWSDGNLSNTAWTVKYVTGSLVPSAISIASSGVAFTTVTADPSGNTQISELDTSGALVASVTLPPGSSAPSGSVSLTTTSTGFVNEVDVSGVTVPYPPGKNISFRVDPATTGVCIDDQPSASVGVTSCTTGPANIPFSLGCSAGVVTSSGPLTFTTGPSPRTFTCTLLTAVGGGTYAVVGGLAYSAVSSVVFPGDALRQVIALVEGMKLPRGIARSLTAKLQAALRSIDVGHAHVAVNHLNAFTSEVKAQTGKQLSPSQAQTLISRAQSIVIALSP